MSAIYNGVSLEDVESMLQQIEWSFNREAQQEDMCCLSSRQDGGYVFLIFLQDAIKPGRFGTVTFVAQFEEGRRNLNALNAWNRDMKYTKAYLSQDGKIRLEMDISAEGLTEQLFIDSLRIYDRSLRQL